MWTFRAVQVTLRRGHSNTTRSRASLALWETHSQRLHLKCSLSATNATHETGQQHAEMCRNITTKKTLLSSLAKTGKRLCVQRLWPVAVRRSAACELDEHFHAATSIGSGSCRISLWQVIGVFLYQNVNSNVLFSFQKNNYVCKTQRLFIFNSLWLLINCIMLANSLRICPTNYNQAVGKNINTVL